jgi:hypothetical protein
VDSVPEFAVDDGLMLAGVGGPLVNSVADVGPVLEKFIKGTFIDCLAVPVSDVFLPELMGEKGG